MRRIWLQHHKAAINEAVDNGLDVLSRDTPSPSYVGNRRGAVNREEFEDGSGGGVDVVVVDALCDFAQRVEREADFVN